MTRASLRLLGGFDAYGADSAHVALPTRKSQALAAVLALSDNQLASRDRLLGLLWGDRGEQQARHSLNQALTSLRRAFGRDAIIADRDMVGFAVTGIDIDTHAFLRHARRDDPASLDAAAALWRGPLLRDFTLREPSFEDWLAIQRATFAEVAAAVMLRAGTLAAQRGDSDRARAAFDQALSIDPLLESAHLALMRLHLGQGNPATALRQYATAAAAIQRELGTVPGRELEAARREAQVKARTAPAPQTVPADPRGERKVATVLAVTFWASDAATCDPEDVQSRLHIALSAAAEQVATAGGRVVQRGQDALLAVFGIPTALEDHAVRACGAAFAIDRGTSVQAGIGTRIALDSGELVMRLDPDGGVHVFGLAMQHASRIAGMIDAPTIAMTDAVRTLMRGRFTVSPRSFVVALPGEPSLVLFEPTGAAHGAPARDAAGFVGREREVALLVAACETAASGHGQLVAVVGEPGIGKSRLMREFTEHHLPQGWRGIVAGTDPQFSDAAYYAIRRLMHGFLDLAGGEGSAVVRSRVERLAEGASSLVAPIMALLDHDPGDPGWTSLDPDIRERRMAEAVIRLLHLQSQQMPLLIVVEDLHWMDAASREALEQLIGILAAARIVLLVNFRPEFVHTWSGLGSFNLVRLDPLRTDASAAMLVGLLGTDPSLDALKASLTDRTGGNPFFLEEWVHMLVASNWLVGIPGAYRVSLTTAAVAIPATVHAVIAARVDRLPVADKRLLQLAAVIGIEVPLALLSAASVDLGGAAFDDTIRRLRNDEFLLPVRLFPDHVMRFKHALTHELVYASLLRQNRRDLHERVLRVLESQATAMKMDVIEKLAYHAVQAEAWEKAVVHARAAGLRSASGNASAAAIGHYTQALAALARLPPTQANKSAEIDLHLEIRDAQFVSGEHDAIPSHLATAISIAEEIGDARRLSHAKLSLSAAHWYAGQHASALTTANEAMMIATDCGDPLLLALSCYRRGVNLGALGRYRESAESLRKSIGLLRDNELTETIAFGGYPFVFCHNFLTWTLAELGDFAASLTVGRTGWDFAWARPNNYSRSVMCFGFGHALIRAGQSDEARTVLESGLALYGVGEVPSTFPYIAAPLGYLLVAAGETDAGFVHLHAAIDPMMRRKAPVYAHIGIWMAEAQRMVGDYPAARQSIKAALDLARAQQEAGHEAWALRCLGDLLAPTDRSAAREAYDQAAQIARSSDMRPLLADVEARLL